MKVESVVHGSHSALLEEILGTTNQIEMISLHEAP